MNVASLEQATKRFGETTALDRVDLLVERGGVLAVLGPNGAGKSTAIALLLGLRRPDSGRARLFGGDPRSARTRTLVGAAPQIVGLPELLTAREVVDLVRAHYAEPDARDDVLARFELLDLAGRQTGGLSTGQKRRLAIALAFAGRPQAVFLDEPTSGLDVESRQALWASIREYAADGGTVVLTTHDLAEADALATRVVVLARGRIVHEGSLDGLHTAAGTTDGGIERAFLSVVERPE